MRLFNDSRMLQRGLPTTLLVIAVIGPASAQEPFGYVPGPAFALFRTGSNPPRYLSTAAAGNYPATYYVEGAAIGAGVFAATGALWSYYWNCRYSDRTSDCAAGRVIAGSAVGALVGGGVGALVGGFFPAPQPRPLRGQAVKTALLGR